MSPSFSHTMPLRSDQPSVGATLRARREELGWQIGDVAEWLRIRPRLLTALEADDLSALPGVAYAVGFLRIYAQAMQLDDNALVEKFRRDYQGVVNRKTDLVFPQPEGDRGLPVGFLVGAGLVVVVAAYAGWYKFASHDVPAQRRVPAVAELMSGAATPATTSPQIASVMPGRAPAPEAAPTERKDGPATAVQPVPAAQPAPSSGETPSTTVKQEAVVSPSVAPVNNDDQKPAEATAPVVPEGAIVVRCLSDVWMQVRDRDGHVLVSRVLKAGEIWQGDSGVAPFRMSFGNAGGVVLSSGGMTSAPLGRQGEVRRNVEVTADAIRSGTFGTGVALPVKAVPGEDVKPDTPVATPPVRHLPARQKPVSEPSADDLNARQLDQSSPSH